MTVSKVFTTFAAINLLRLPVKVIPMVLRSIIEAGISFRRLNKLLHLPELRDPRMLNGVAIEDLPNGESNAQLLVNRPDSDLAVIAVDCEFSWHPEGDMAAVAFAEPESKFNDKNNDNNENENKTEEDDSVNSTIELTAPAPLCAVDDGDGLQLSDLALVEESKRGILDTPRRRRRKLFSLRINNLSIRKGELVCVVGVVGSGKTSFLNALLGELMPVATTDTTTFDVCGHHSYVAQTACTSLTDTLFFFVCLPL